MESVANMSATTVTVDHNAVNELSRLWRRKNAADPKVNYFGDEEEERQQPQREPRITHQQYATDEALALAEEKPAEVEAAFVRVARRQERFEHQSASVSRFDNIVDHCVSIRTSWITAKNPFRKKLPSPLEWVYDVDKACTDALNSYPRLHAIYVLLYVQHRLTEEQVINIGWQKQLVELKQRCVRLISVRKLHHRHSYHNHTTQYARELDI
jgi:hypothetical protein